FGGLEHAGAACGDGGSKLPGGHEQRVVPGNDLTGDADGLAHGKAQSVGRNRIHAASDFVGEATVILETGCHVGDVIFRFDNGLAGVAAFKLGELPSALADFFRYLEEDAAAVLGGGSSPRPGVK